MYQGISTAGRVFFVLSALLFIALPLEASDSEPAIGAVTSLRSEVHVKRPGQATAKDAVRGTPIRTGDIIRTGMSGSCQVAFTDESFAILGNSTAIRINQYSFDAERNRRTAVMQIMKGQARVVIFRQRSKESRFRVEARTAAVDPDLVADFIVLAGENETEVISLRNALRVRNLSSFYVGEYRLRENQHTKIKQHLPPDKPGSISRARRQRLLEMFRGR